jgi:phage major head subunit gpT-like protein
MSTAALGIRGFIGDFYRRLDTVTAESWAGRIAMMMPTDQAVETYKWLGMVPAMREWIGGRKPAALRDQGMIIENRKYEASLEIDADDLRRDKTSQIRTRIGELASRSAEHWAKLLTALIIANPLAYDGAAFFSATHTENESGTQKNLLVAADVPALDVAVAANPTVAEMGNVIMGLTQYMMGYKDDRGEPMNFNGRRYVLMVPLNMWAAAKQAVSLPVILSGGQSVTNAITNFTDVSWEVIYNPRLTSTTELYLFREDSDVRALIMQNEIFETGVKDDTFDNNRWVFGVKAIRNVGTGYWQNAIKATLS